jgi:high-affinity Fe2+/Pb2+ permease
LAKRLAGNGARRVVLALETGVVMAVAGLFVVAIVLLHLWEATWKPRT